MGSLFTGALGAASVSLPQPNLLAISPVIALTVAAVLVLGCVIARPLIRGVVYPVIAMAGLVAALALALIQLGNRPVTTFSGNWRTDAFSLFFTITVVIAGILAVLISDSWLTENDVPQAEFYAVLLCSVIGAIVSASAYNLIALFVGIELMSVPTYILTGFAKHNRVSNEAALKYSLLGGFSTAILLYGLTWTYGVTGETGYPAIRGFVGNGQGGFHAAVLLASMLVIAGLGFKIAAVPFHMWTPDAYQGAPTVVTAFMSVSVKAGAFAALVRILTDAFGGIYRDWSPILIVIAIVTMVLGNVVAIVQNDVKRMLAYSSIAHTGFMLVGLATWNPGNAVGVSGVLFYAFAYTFMNLGAFGMLAWLEAHGAGTGIDDVNGLFSRAPLAALGFSACLLGLMGFPFTVGLPAKVFVFQAAAGGGYVWLALLSLLLSAVGAVYYFRPMVRMFMHEPKVVLASPRQTVMAVGLGVAALGTVLLGVLFSPVFDLAQRAATGG